MPTFTLTIDDLTRVEADLLVLPVFQGPVAGPGVKEASKALGADLLVALGDAKLEGKRGQHLTVPVAGPVSGPASGLRGVRSILLVGLGEKKDLDLDGLRDAAGRIAKAVSRYERVATTLAQVARGITDGAAAVTEGMLLGGYRFDRYKTKDVKPPALTEVLLLVKDAAALRSAKPSVANAALISECVTWARDLVNTPSGDATPEVMAEHAKTMAKEVGLQVKVWSPAEMEKGSFGGVLGVGRGSANPPRFVELTYSGGKAGAAPVALVGKGITFDSGGLSIKGAKSMEWMKVDKAGASATLAAMRAIALLKPKINVIACIPFAENMPGGNAQRPGDVITHRNGMTSEVLNTDAEGRLVLADALSLAVERGAEAIVDAATLTGACMVALGDEVTGVFGNDRSVTREVLAAGKAVGEPGWEMPLWKGYRKQIDSNVADIKNIGGGYAGAITAALFLKEFVGETPWVHLDVAGPAWTDSGTDLGPKGGTGTPVRTMVRWVLSRAESSARR